jgi:phage terminase small subunit
MGRASKSVDLLSREMSKQERYLRKSTEEKLKGNPSNIEPSSRLNANQKKIFKYIVSELGPSEILGNLDMFMLENGCIAIDRLQSIEKEINRDFSLIYNKELMAAKTKYSTEFFKFVNEACLSPQARAKMGILAANKKLQEQDPLLAVLKSKSS